MRNKILLCSLAAALLAGGYFATRTAAADDFAPPAPRARIFQRLAEKLGLTADQKAQIKTILLGEQDTLQPLLVSLHDARMGLRTAIRASDANETSVRAASANVAAAEADLAVERMKLYGKIAPVLTPEQLKRAADLQARADESVDNTIARLGSSTDN
jgi:Spy/CpxP family protein refolding chaperone